MTRRFDLAFLAAWTLLVWVGRLRNVVVDDDLSGWSFTWRLLVALGFTSVGLALAALLILHRLSVSMASGSARLGAGLAVVGSIWWLVRGIGILVADYSVGFKLVHSALALVTVLVSLTVLRTQQRGTVGQRPLATG